MTHSCFSQLRIVTWPLVWLLLALPLRVEAAFLTFVEAHKNNVGGVTGLAGALSVAVSPDGQYVYAAGTDDDAVVVFHRASGTGALTFVEALHDAVGGVHGIAGPTSVALSPDGKHLYVAGGNENAVAVFARDPSAGTLTFLQVVTDGVGGVSDLMAPQSVTVSPDGHHVYAAAFSSDALVVFARDSSSGLLTFVQSVVFTTGVIDGLRGASDVAVSPDGAHVYATGQTDNAVSIFSRNSTSGMLSYVGVQRDGLNGVDGIAAASALTVSPDGRQVYVTGFNAEAIAVFSRNSSSGELTFVEVQRDTVNGVSGLVEPLDVAVSDDGTHVYVASNSSNALAVFSRNANSGTLSFVEAETQGTDGVDGLTGAAGVAVSPDGNSVYVAGSKDNAVAVFAHQLPVATPTFTATPVGTAVQPTATPTGPTNTPPRATATRAANTTPSSSGGGGGCAIGAGATQQGVNPIALLIPLALLWWRRSLLG